MAKAAAALKTDDLEALAPKGKKPGAEHARLNELAGDWAVTGSNLDGSRQKVLSKIDGEGAHHWLPGGFFLSGVETARSSDGSVHVTHMIFGWEPEAQAYRAWFHDNGGFSRTYRGSVDGNIWSFAGKFERVKIEVSKDGRMLKHFWERTENGTDWFAICELTSRRLNQ